MCWDRISLRGCSAFCWGLSRPSVRFNGIVDSVGYGVTPDADVITNLGNGLPDLTRTLNWVHLASRYPVRVRISEPPSDSLRLGETAIVIIRGN